MLLTNPFSVRHNIRGLTTSLRLKALLSCRLERREGLLHQPLTNVSFMLSPNYWADFSGPIQLVNTFWFTELGHLALAMETPQPHHRKTPEPGSNCCNVPAVQQGPQMKWFWVLVECWWLELTKGSPCGSPEFCCFLLASDFSALFIFFFFFCYWEDSTGWSGLHAKLIAGTVGCHNTKWGWRNWRHNMGWMVDKIPAAADYKANSCKEKYNTSNMLHDQI